MGLFCVRRAATQRHFVFAGLQHNDILCSQGCNTTTFCVRKAATRHFVFAGLQHNDILCSEGCNTTTFCVRRAATQRHFPTSGRLRFGETFDDCSGEGCVTVTKCNSAFSLGRTKTTGKLDRLARSQDLPDCKLASSLQSGFRSHEP